MLNMEKLSRPTGSHKLSNSLKILSNSVHSGYAWIVKGRSMGYVSKHAIFHKFKFGARLQISAESA